MRSIAEWLQYGVEQLVDSPSARCDVEVLLTWVLKKDRAYLFTWPERSLSVEDEGRFLDALVARKAGQPVAFITGEKEFWSLPFYTAPSTLIPRPDTEVLVEKALSLLPEYPAKILDLGAGTGAIAMAIASERTDCAVDAVDCSEPALALAEKNRTRLQLDNVRLFHSEWFSSVSDSYDLIVSNPPYIDEKDPHLSMGDLVFEPRSALVASDNGLADIRSIVSQARGHLRDHAWLMIEHGWQQREQVQGIFLDEGYESVSTVKDYGGNDRVTLGCRR